MRPTTPFRFAALHCGLLAGLLFLAFGCDSGPGASIYDPDPAVAPDPVITSVEPGESALAGIDIVTITGENFSATMSENLVYFDEERAEVIEASPTQLRVLPPNIPRPEITLRVAVLGAENYGSATYRLDAAAERVGSLAVGTLPRALATDAAGNIYVSLDIENNNSVKRFTPDGERSDFSPRAAFGNWGDLAVGPDGALYGILLGLGGVFRLPEGVTAENVGVLGNGSEPFNSLAFDGRGMLWVGSTAGNLFRFDPNTGVFDEFELDSEIANTTVRDLAVFGDFLYVALTQQAEGEAQVGKVVRFMITESGLGDREDYVQVSSLFGVNPRALAFAADGSLLVGTSASADVSNETSLLLIAPDGSADVFYPGIVAAPVTALAWGADTKVYAIGRVAGDPGSSERVLADLIRIETRRAGA